MIARLTLPIRILGILSIMFAMSAAGGTTAQGATLPTSWTIIDIPQPPDTTDAKIMALNEAGRAVGYMFSPAVQAQLPFLIVDGELRLLGGEGADAQALDISNDGVVVGVRYDGMSTAAVTLRSDEMVEIGPGGAVGINDANEIAGVSGNDAVIWRNGVAEPLPNLIDGGASSPTMINNNGMVVGAAQSPAQEYHAVAWIDGEAVDLAAPAGEIVSAVDVNDDGQVIGITYADNSVDSWTWTDGTLTPLPNGPNDTCTAAEINSSGIIVGDCTGPDGIIAVAWVDGELVDLNSVISPDSGWILRYATAINNAGAIAGLGEWNDLWSMFIMTPGE